MRTNDFKSMLLGFILCGTIIFASSFMPPIEAAQAEVNYVDGYYIFTDSKPVNKYIHLGSVKGPSLSLGSGQYMEVRDKLIKRAKKDFPKADALIFTFATGQIDKCEAIKFQ